MDVTHDVTQRVLVGGVSGPPFQLLLAASEGLLEVTQPQTVPQQTPGSQSPEVGTRSFLVQALADHELYQEIRDAGAS